MGRGYQAGGGNAVDIDQFLIKEGGTRQVVGML